MTLRTIHLHGALKQFSAEPFELAAHDMRDVISGLKSRFPGFKQHISEGADCAIVLTDEGGKNPRPVYPEFICSPFDNVAEVHIVQDVSGAGLEVALAAYLGGGLIAGIVAGVIVNIGVALILGAVMQMISPQTKSDPNGNAAVDQRPSFIYNGAINVTEQGYQVPVVYGTHMTGSVVVSTGVTVEQLGVTPVQAPAPSGTVQASPPSVPDQWVGAGGF